MDEIIHSLLYFVGASYRLIHYVNSRPLTCMYSEGIPKAICQSLKGLYLITFSVISRIKEIHISIFWTHDVFEGHTILLLCYCFVLPCFVFISTFISIFSKFTKPILRDNNISWKYDHPPLQFHFDGIFLSSRVNATSLLFDSSSKLVYNVNVYCKLITSLSQRYTKDPYL